MINWRQQREDPSIPLCLRYSAYGMGRRPFTMLKVRSRPDGSALEQGLHRTGLDKTPQLLNLLSGRMSMVGPRPRLVEDEPGEGNGVHNVHTVKPGIIGPWTISSHWISGDETQDEL